METVLYLGLRPPKNLPFSRVIHYPVITIKPYPSNDRLIKQAMAQFEKFTHLIFTSKTSLEILLSFLSHYHLKIENLQKKTIIAVGRATAERVNLHQLQAKYIASDESAEGIITILQDLDLKGAHLFWPHSDRARPLISQFLKEKEITYTETNFYTTATNQPNRPLNFDEIDSILFTSPSTVDGFLSHFKLFPPNKNLLCIGPITQAYLDAKRSDKS